MSGTGACVRPRAYLIRPGEQRQSKQYTILRNEFAKQLKDKEISCVNLAGEQLIF